MAARIARMATMHTISRRVKPSSPEPVSSRPADDIGCRSGSTFLTIRTIGHDIVSAVLPWRAILIRVAPGIVGHDRALQVRSVPGHRAARTLHQRSQPFRARRVTAIIQEVEIERAGKALDLNLGGLRLRLGQVIEHSRTDQTHDQADDGDDHQDLHQGKATFAVARGTAASQTPQACSTIAHLHAPCFHPTIWLTDNSDVITDTIRPPTTMLIVMIAAGPAIPTTRSRLRCSLAS